MYKCVFARGADTCYNANTEIGAACRRETFAGSPISSSGTSMACRNIKHTFRLFLPQKSNMAL
eukprot:9493125-Pyramimonas_sp.AAC.1